jgi:hypothetical protein
MKKREAPDADVGTQGRSVAGARSCPSAAGAQTQRTLPIFVTASATLDGTARADSGAAITIGAISRIRS